MNLNDNASTRVIFMRGLRDGIPIALGYFAVSFSLGIFGRSVGLTPFQGFLASAVTMASAGQYAGFALMGAGATLVEMAIMILITNARYMLMSAALSQKFSPDMPFFHRFLVGAVVTDELFGIGINYPGYLSPFYMYGAIAVTIPGWSVGTALGIIAGNILPLRLVSALTVAIYGMFIAIIIPASKRDRVVLGAVLTSFAASFAFSRIEALSAIPEGTRTIILTLAISAAAALLFPAREEAER